MIVVSSNSSGSNSISVNNGNNRNVSLSAAVLQVGGCVKIDGNVSLNLQAQPQQGNSTLEIISYNCTSVANLSSSQIQLDPNYQQSSCDQISYQVINNPGSVSLLLSNQIGTKCGGISKGAIIGIATGIPVGLSAILGAVLAILRNKRKQKFDAQLENVGNEMNTMK